MMDYYEWVASQLGKTAAVVDWKDIPAEDVSDPNLTTHAGTVRQTWVGDKVVLTRVVVKPDSRGKPHFHPAEQVSMILRGGVRVLMDGKSQLAMAGAIVHIPGNAVHMFEILGEETEILDVYTVTHSVDELRKQYPWETSMKKLQMKRSPPLYLAAAAGVAALAMTAHEFALAQSAGAFPQRPMRMVLSVPPGGAADFTGRVVAAKMAEFVGQNVVVESRPGAGGIVASSYITQASPDGYTLMLSSSTTHGAAPVVYKKLPYDTIKDFTHISGVSLLPAMVVVNVDVPAKTIKEFIALTKANPGKYLFSSSGNGSAPQLFGENLKIRTGADITHVPYKGSGPAVVDLASGQVHLMMDGLPSLMPQIKAGRLRPIAAMSKERFAVFPDVPTMAEAGFPGMEDGVWYGMSAPAGVPLPIVNQIAILVAKVVTSSDVSARFATLGGIPMPIGPKEYLAFIQAENKKWGEIVRKAGVVPN